MKRKTKSKIIYLSGPITGAPDYLVKFDLFERLIKRAYPPAEIINPAAVCDRLPHCLPYEAYMEVCLPLVRRSDLLVLLPGWERSIGCEKEMNAADLKHIKIMMVDIDDKGKLTWMPF